MASRYPVTHPVQRCENPVRVFRNGHFDYFPCGRCPACLLDKANSWSVRVADEIESTPFPIFFTLTYNNKYLPKLKLMREENGLCFYSSNHDCNVRFNSVEDVKRDDDILLFYDKKDIPIKNFQSDGGNYINYCSKRDIQLWLKLMRQDVYKTFNLDNYEESERKQFYFRYFIISEYGPTTNRAHYHGLLFAYFQDVAEYLVRLSMFKNWQMCDKSLFEQYTHYCEGGAASYVTQYLTCSSNLPEIFKDKQVRPFRLASKSPAIGFIKFDKKEIFENIFQGINEYSKTVSRIGSKYIFPYPSDFAHRLFPKCREYGLLPYKRLRYIYGFLWRNVVKRGFSYDTCNGFIRKKWFPADVTAAQKCYQAWNLDKDYHVHPETFLYLVDMYYYKEAMFALAKFYEWQEINASNSVSIMFSYSNFGWYFKESKIDNEKANTFAHFLYGFGLTIDELDDNAFNSLVSSFPENMRFRDEVDDILKDMVKMPKFNEQFGFAPHII